jgi:DNA invertase Pin-like site-specific DNA recombinase
MATFVTLPPPSGLRGHVEDGSSSCPRSATSWPPPRRPAGVLAGPGCPDRRSQRRPQNRPAHRIRIGYARCSNATQELASKLDALKRAHCTRIFSEQISSRIKIRSEFQAALTLAREIKTAAPNQPVILTVHEMKRLGRNAAELMALSATLQADEIQLELLTGPLAGIFDSHGMGNMLFAVLAVAAQLDRDYIREKTLEGQQAAAARGNYGGRPKVVDPSTSKVWVRAKWSPR